VRYCFQEPVNIIEIERRMRFDITIMNRIPRSPQIEVTRYDRTDQGWYRNLQFKCIVCTDYINRLVYHKNLHGCGETGDTREDKTLIECADLCYGERSCSSFRWGNLYGKFYRQCTIYMNCWPKDANRFGKQPESYEFFTIPNSPASLYHEYKYLSCEGYNDLGFFGGISIIICADICNQNPNCIGFDWHVDPRSDIGGCALSQSCIPEWATQATDTDLWIKRDDIFNITTLQHQACNWTQPIGVRYIRDCARECLNQELCLSFQYGRVDGHFPQQCMLTASCVDGITAPHMDFDVHILQSYQTILGKYVPAPGRECLYKKELGRFEGYSLGKCAYECSGNPYCVSFQWRSAPIFAQTELEKKLTSRCDLSASCMGEFTIRSSPGNNLYFKNDSLLWGYKVFKNSRCIDPRWKLRTTRTSTLSQCAQRCSNNGVCVSFAYGRMDYGRATECMMFGPCSAGRDLEFDLFVNVLRQTQRNPLKWFKAHPHFHCLTSDVLNQYLGLTIFDCALRCMKNLYCDSYQFHSPHDGHSKTECVQMKNCKQLKPKPTFSPDVLYRYTGFAMIYRPVLNARCVGGSAIGAHYGLSSEECRSKCDKFNCMSYAIIPAHDKCVLYARCSGNNLVEAIGSTLYYNKYNLMAYRVFDQREFTYQPMLEINATVKACISACDYVKCLAFHISPPAGVPHRICKLYNRVNLQSTTRALAHWNTYVLPLHSSIFSDFVIYGTKTCAISDRHLDYGPQSLSNCGGASLRKGAKAFLYGAKDGRFPKSCLLFETCTETTGGNADYNLYKSIVKDADVFALDFEVYELPDALPEKYFGSKWPYKTTQELWASH
jgi:hypothetical protein